MKNVFINLLNWVLGKGLSETKKDQASSKKDQVKRTKLNEKRTKWGTSKVQVGYKLSKKGTGLAGESMEGRSWGEGSLTSGRASNEHPLSIHSASIGRGWTKMWRYAAMVTLLLTLACGNAWGA